MYEEFVIPPPLETPGPFTLHMAGISYCDGDYQIARAPQDIHVFEYVEAGRGTLIVDGRSYEPAAGDVYIVPAWTRHRYFSSADDPWIKYWFNVSGPLVGELIELYGLSGCHCLRSCPVGELFREGLKRVAAADIATARREAVETVTGIIAAISASRYGREAQGVSAEGVRMRDYLESRLTKAPPSLETLARLIGKSPVQALRIFKRDFHITPMNYLTERKIQAARELLAGSNRSVKEVAQQLGFGDEYYFARLFKKKTGGAPGQYRRVARGGSVLKAPL